MDVNPQKIATPNYVLMDHNQRVGPAVAQLDSKTACTAIYGFSDKVLFDMFCGKNPHVLQPYPLVKGYLENQVGMPGSCLKLVVLNATGPEQSSLSAATVEAVLEAQQNQKTYVMATHHLVFSREANMYRLEETSA